jgi:hypothetical protein
MVSTISRRSQYWVELTALTAQVRGAWSPADHLGGSR